MPEVYFYHLTRSPLEETLPDLLEKCRARNWNVLVKAKDDTRLTWLDARLWLGADTGFLPHGLAGSAYDADQPVLLTTQETNPNAAQILMAVDGAAVSQTEIAGFLRVCVLFDGNDDAALMHARAQWKQITDLDCPARYWSQESGSWAEKASKNIA